MELEVTGMQDKTKFLGMSKSSGETERLEKNLDRCSVDIDGVLYQVASCVQV